MIFSSLYFKKQFFISFKIFYFSLSTNLPVQKKLLKNKFINLLLKNGNKNNIEILFLNIVKNINKSTKKSFLNVIKYSIVNNYIILMLKKSKNQKFKKKSLKKTMIPFILKKQNRLLLSLKSIIFLSKKNSKNCFFLALKSELIDSFLNFKTKTHYNSELYKLIFLKKNFAHYRWFI